MDRVLAAVSLIASFVAVGVSVQAMRVPKEKEDKRTESHLAKYDLTTPAAAYTSMLRMVAANDLEALQEYNYTASKSELEERRDTTVVVKQVEHKGQILLFVKRNHQGLPKQSVERMEKDAKTGLWVTAGGLYYVTKDDGAIGEMVEMWLGTKKIGLDISQR